MQMTQSREKEIESLLRKLFLPPTGKKESSELWALRQNESRRTVFGPLCVQFPLPGMRLLWLFTWLPPAQQSGPSSDVTFLDMSSKVVSPTPLLSVTSTFLFPSRNYHDLEMSCGFHLLYIVCLSI